MRRPSAAMLCAIYCAAPLAADPLADMAGTWRGAGWARETVQGPQETVRCQITNSYDASALTLAIKGRCAVPGRKLSLAGTLKGADGSTRITGQWFNPDGLGATAIVGLQQDGIIAFNFAATDPKTGSAVSQNVEWRVTESELRLRATDRADPSAMMSDITFTK